MPLCSSPLPPVLGPRPLGVPTSRLPSPLGFLRRGGRGVREGQRRKPGCWGGGGDEGTASCLLESPGVMCSSRPGLGPGALCWPEPRAPAAAGERCGGREGAAQLCAQAALRGRPRAARARAAVARGCSHPLPAPQPRSSPPSPVSAIAACRASRRPGLGCGGRAARKVTVAARFLPERQEFLCYLHLTGLSL